MKRFGTLILCIILLVGISPVQALADSYITIKDIDEGLDFCKDYPVKLVLDGAEIPFPESDVPPVIIAGRTLIPARALFESMGGMVTWNNEKRTVDVMLGEATVILTIDSNVAWVNGEAKTLEVPAMIIDHDGDYFGSTMIPVRFTAEALGCNVNWHDPDRSVVIASPQAQMPDWLKPNDLPAEQPGSATASAIISESAITSEAAVTTGGGVIPESPSGKVTGPAINFWEPFTYEPLPMMNEAAATKLIAVDLGHGGKDTGSIGHEKKSDELYEKTINLKVGRYLKEYLTQAGANLYMIRETDVYYTLLERAGFANEAGAQIFVSIHNNSSDYGWPNGTEVHYYSKKDANGMDEMQLYGIYSKEIAQAVQNEMLNALGTYDREIKESPKLAVLNKTSMPAIIVEGAFLSNEENFEMLKTDEYAKRYAYAVAKGLITVMNDTYQ